MKKVLSVIVFCLLVGTAIHGQCKYMKDGNSTLKLYEKKTQLDFKMGTKIKTLMAKKGINGFKGVMNFSFVKTIEDENMLLIIYTKSFASNFYIDDTTPFILFFEGGETIELFSPKKIEGKNNNLTQFRITPCYNLVSDYFDLLSNNEIVGLKIYFNSEKKTTKYSKDDKGTYFEYDIKGESKRENVIEASNCFLKY